MEELPIEEINESIDIDNALNYIVSGLMSMPKMVLSLSEAILAIAGDEDSGFYHPALAAVAKEHIRVYGKYARHPEP